MSYTLDVPTVVNDLHEHLICPKCYEDSKDQAKPGTLRSKDTSSPQAAFTCQTCSRQTSYTMLINQLPKYCIERWVGLCPNMASMISFITKAHLTTTTKINEYISAFYVAKAAEKQDTHNMKTPSKQTADEKTTVAASTVTSSQVINVTTALPSPTAILTSPTSANIEDKVAMLSKMINQLSQENHELKATIANMTAEVSKLQ